MSVEATKLKCDLLVVGGGINGVGIARDAAGRDLSVILCEKDDLASHTSSASSKLIHGGLRYLEYYEFGLVRKALIERETLMRIAPHIISPIRFVMPHVKGLRPPWLLRLGLFFYDHMARRELLPGSTSVQLRKHEAGLPLRAELTRGFMYSDAWVDDARLVALNALDAAEHGAQIFTRTGCTSLRQNQGRWLATLSAGQPDDAHHHTWEIDAACVVNATGSWAAQFQRDCASHLPDKHLRLIKGSHIVVKRLFEHHHAYLFQHPDGRIVFAIPYEGEFTLIGTTDLEYSGSLDDLQIADSEIDYLCELSNQYFSHAISPKDVLWSYSGVRPLVDDGSRDAKAVTRDYNLEFEHDGAPILHVFGGKITTYRRLAEDAMRYIAPALQCENPEWTAAACLPGGDICTPQASNQNVRGMADFAAACQQQYCWLPSTLLERWVKNYGTRLHRLLQGCSKLSDLGDCILENLYAIEVLYLMKYEYAKSAHDILWRRSKLGLHLPSDAEQTLSQWILQNT